MPAKLSVTSSVTGFVTPCRVKSPVTFPVFSSVRSNFVLWKVASGNLFGIEKLIAFHVVVENRHKALDAVRLERYLELAFSGFVSSYRSSPS